MDNWQTGADDLTSDVAQLSSIEFLLKRILNIAIPLAGLTLFIMLLAGGITWLTAGGDPEKAKKAQGTLTWAIAGFVLLIASWFILGLISQFTGVELTKLEFDW